MNILTFDIEDWFHSHQNRKYYSGHIWKDLPSKVMLNTDIILELLDEIGIKATFFVLGWVAVYHPGVVKKIHSKGHEIGAHSHWHHNPQLLSPEDFNKDLKLCLDAIENVTGEKVTMYRAPGFNLKLRNKQAFEILSENGIKIDSSVQIYFAEKRAPITVELDNENIFEFPLFTTPFGIPYSGGGFFRVLPYKFIDYCFNKYDYNLIYLHPRDFDTNYPFFNMFSLYRNMLNKFNTDTSKSKLLRLLSKYKTVTMGEAINNYN
jgi:polysaccharide deacetylase family protein (PEP-CTERM system associated)